MFHSVNAFMETVDFKKNYFQFYKDFKSTISFIISIPHVQIC